MNKSQSPKARVHQIGAGVKAAALVSVLGLIVLIADHALVVPAEIPMAGASSRVVPYEATSLSADGRGVAAIQPSPSTGGAVAEQQASVSAPRQYPEPASDAVRDEGGHPPSF